MRARIRLRSATSTRVCRWGRRIPVGLNARGEYHARNRAQDIEVGCFRLKIEGLFREPVSFLVRRTEVRVMQCRRIRLHGRDLVIRLPCGELRLQLANCGAGRAGRLPELAFPRPRRRALRFRQRHFVRPRFARARIQTAPSPSRATAAAGAPTRPTRR